MWCRCRLALDLPNNLCSLLFYPLQCLLLVEGAALSGSGRVLRGGAWNNNPRNCRSAYRNNNDPDERNDNIGFRVVSVSFGLALPLRRLSSVPGIPAFTDAGSVVPEVLALLLSCRAGVPATESTSQDRAGLVGDCIRTCRAAFCTPTCSNLVFSRRFLRIRDVSR
ncbi:MAG: SUMF1/EgtB/PvdO family nonheme iron enzyme [Phycisphaerae bacterium]|nr:SUMF1/EgtB/PvdO family nonheme iron enzyme [Phycisphaerae bacterium]